MGLFDWLLGRRDPTVGWPDFQPFPLVFDLTQRQFGPLRFGDSLDIASAIGQPDLCGEIRTGVLELVYARAGFKLEFIAKEFVYLAFFIGPDELLPKHPELRFSEPQLDGWASHRVSFSRNTSVAELRSRLGPPDEEETDDEETVLSYSRAGVAMEFELDLEDHLKRWDVYHYPTNGVA